jgi:hypothetical protein
MASASAASLKEDLINTIYNSLVADGVDPGEAAAIAESVAADPDFHIAAVDRYITQALNMIPANLPPTQRAYYATAIITAFRGNDYPWQLLLEKDATFLKLFGNQKPPHAANPDDVDLSFAEHYMRERYEVGFTGDPKGAADIVRKYAAGKRLAFEKNVSAVYKRSDRNPSPPSRAQEWWGLAGVLRGEKDYTESNPGKPGIPFGTYLLEGNVITFPKTKPQKNSTNIWIDLFNGLLIFASQDVGSAVTQCQGTPVQTMGVEVIPGPSSGL